MIVARTRSVDETRELAAALCELVLPGDLLLLAGDLGAGKTAFTQGFGLALGVTDPITSPTFTLVNRYEGRLVLYHLDVYRLEQVNEVLDLDLPEMLDDRAVTIIEWGDAIAGAVPPEYLEVRFLYPEPDDDDSDDDRGLHLRPVGPRWTARSRTLAAALERWVARPVDDDADGGGSNC